MSVLGSMLTTPYAIQQYIQSSVRRPDHIQLTAISHSDAQGVLDEIWKVLDSAALPVLLSHTESQFFKYRNSLRKLSLRLSIDHDILPSTLVLKGVECTTRGRVGAGGFADIYMGTFHGAKVGLKCLRGYSRETDEGKVATKRFYRESLLWKNLIHPNIVQFFGIAENLFEDTICMVIPWMENGSLRHFIASERKEGQLMGEEYVQAINIWLYQIAEGLAYLHDEGLVHGDLHGGNVLIDDDGNARLTDFGMALVSEATSYGYASSHGGGAIRWTAPELIDPEEFEMEDSRPTPASDIFSFACMAVELYSGKPPLSSLANHQVQRRYVKGERPERPDLPDGGSMPDDIWTLTGRCWAQLASDRPPASEVVIVMAVIAHMERKEDGRAEPVLVDKVQAMTFSLLQGSGSVVSTLATSPLSDKSGSAQGSLLRASTCPSPETSSSSNVPTASTTNSIQRTLSTPASQTYPPSYVATSAPGAPQSKSVATSAVSQSAKQQQQVVSTSCSTTSASQTVAAQATATAGPQRPASTIAPRPQTQAQGQPQKPSLKKPNSLLQAAKDLDARLDREVASIEESLKKDAKTIYAGYKELVGDSSSSSGAAASGGAPQQQGKKKSIRKILKDVWDA